MSDNAMPKHHSGVYKVAIHSISFIISLVIVVLVVGYTFGVYYFKEHFYPNTTINGVSVGGMSARDADVAVLETFPSYMLTVRLREAEFKISGSDFGFRWAVHQSAKTFLDNQNSLLWFKGIFESQQYEVSGSSSFSETLLEASAKERLSYYLENRDSVPATVEMTSDHRMKYIAGTKAIVRDDDKSVQLIVEAVKSGMKSLDLRNSEAYAERMGSVHDDDLRLLAQDWNSLGTNVLTYRLDGKTFTYDVEKLYENARLNGNRIEVKTQFILDELKRWLSLDDDYVVSEYGAIVPQVMRQAFINRYLSESIPKLVQDMKQRYTDGTILSPNTTAGFLSDWYFRFDVASGVILLMHDDQVVSSHAVQLSGYTDWNIYHSCIVSVTRPANKALALSCGLIMGLSDDEPDIIVSDMKELMDEFREHNIQFMTVIGPGESDYNAWYNPIDLEYQGQSFELDTEWITLDQLVRD